MSIKAFIDKSESRVAGISARQVIGFAFESRSGRIQIAGVSQAYRRRIGAIVSQLDCRYIGTVGNRV